MVQFWLDFLPNPAIAGLPIPAVAGLPIPAVAGLPIRPSAALTIPILSSRGITYTGLGGARRPMGTFIFGLVVGFGAALMLFIYDEGEVFLKLARQIKLVAGKYKAENHA